MSLLISENPRAKTRFENLPPEIVEEKVFWNQDCKTRSNLCDTSRSFRPLCSGLKHKIICNLENELSQRKWWIHEMESPYLLLVSQDGEKVLLINKIITNIQDHKDCYLDISEIVDISLEVNYTIGIYLTSKVCTFIFQ